MKLKDCKSCQCAGADRAADRENGTVYKYCRFGYCTMVICSRCGFPWCDWGPIECPHKKNENGTLRWYKYPDMDNKPHVAVKRSKIMRKRSRPRRFR